MSPLVRLTCPKARRTERLVGHDAEVVCGDEMVTVRTASGAFGVGHGGADAGREQALDYLLAREIERAEHDLIDTQRWAASEALDARAWLACPGRLDTATRKQHESAALYAEARRLYDALFGTEAEALAKDGAA